LPRLSWNLVVVHLKRKRLIEIQSNDARLQLDRLFITIITVKLIPAKKDHCSILRRSQGEHYRQLLQSRPPWPELYKGPSFLAGSHGYNLDYSNYPPIHPWNLAKAFLLKELTFSRLMPILTIPKNQNH
jgi:hypothetical protein